MLDFEMVVLGEEGPVCRACGSTGPAPAAPHGEDVAAAVRASDDPTGHNVEIGGPDRVRLLAATKEAVAAGAARVRIRTDAAGLSEEDADALIGAGARSLRFRLLGGAAHTHDRLVGRRGHFDEVRAGVRAYRRRADERSATVAISAYVPVCRHCVQDVPGIVSAAAETGAQEVLLEVVDPGLDVVTAGPWFGAGCDTGTVNVTWVGLRGVPYCAVPEHALHVGSTVREVSEGAKAPACARCPLTGWCPGVPAGAAGQVKGRLGPPETAEHLARMLAIAWEVPE